MSIPLFAKIMRFHQPHNLTFIAYYIDQFQYLLETWMAEFF